MIITYLGHASFKVQYGDIVLSFNPISKESNLKYSRFGADVALVSLNDKDFNGVGNLESGNKSAFAITGPGEYEIKGVFIKGFKSQSNYGGKSRLNTIFLLTLENINLCFLGAMNGEVDKETLESLDNIDILFVPIGGNGVLDSSAAYKLAVNLEPKIIIPMLFGEEKSDSLKKFLKEGGDEKPTIEEKLTIKKKDLEGKEGEILVLKAQA